MAWFFITVVIFVVISVIIAARNPLWVLFIFLSLLMIIPMRINSVYPPEDVKYSAICYENDKKLLIWFNDFKQEGEKVYISEYYKDTSNCWQLTFIKVEKYTDLVINVDKEFEYNVRSEYKSKQEIVSE